jgi:acyl phosphate:glycerol-3-phosphate acyltransferase
MSTVFLCLLGYVLGHARLGPSKPYANEPSLLFALIEVAKGALLWLCCVFLLPTAGWLLMLPAFAYALGARLPLAFRTHRGHAVATLGTFLACQIVYFCVRQELSWSVATTVMVIVLLLVVATRTWMVPALVASTYLVAILPLSIGCVALGATMIALYVASESLHAVVRHGVFSFAENGETKLWRIIARPFAALFVLIDLLASRRVLLLVIGAVALVFIGMDFVRLATKAELRGVFKKKEHNRFSSMTLFLVSIFLAFLLFPATIPYVSLVCITFGDFFSKIVGIRFGTHKLYRSRTLEGTFGFLAGSLMFGSICAALLPIPLLYVVIGSCIAAIVELFSESIDDNFSVAIVTGGVLSALRYFAGI